MQTIFTCLIRAFIKFISKRPVHTDRILPFSKYILQVCLVLRLESNTYDLNLSLADIIHQAFIDLRILNGYDQNPTSALCSSAEHN